VAEARPYRDGCRLERDFAGLQALGGHRAPVRVRRCIDHARRCRRRRTGSLLLHRHAIPAGLAGDQDRADRDRCGAERIGRGAAVARRRHRRPAMTAALCILFGTMVAFMAAAMPVFLALAFAAVAYAIAFRPAMPAQVVVQTFVQGLDNIAFTAIPYFFA